MRKKRPISEQVFMEKFKDFFEKLHRAVTGSEKITQLEDVAIFEKKLSSEESVYFYFFHGNAEEQERFFPGENEAYCTFRQSSSTITASSGDKFHDFFCSFGYILHVEELSALFRSSEQSERAAQWINVQICSHEIRHEMQLRHDAKICKLDSFPPTPKDCKGAIDWDEVRTSLELLYQGYVGKDHDDEYLAREHDAIAISFMCLMKWFEGASFSKKARMCELAEIIKK